MPKSAATDARRLAMQPVPRLGIYDTYWRFAAERQAVFDRRVAGQAGPWTADPILQRFKFCNTFRAADRVSQYLIARVIEANRDLPAADRLFQIVAFRTFSKIETWQALTHRLGHAPVLADLASGTFENALGDLRGAGATIYTSAFILCATRAYGHAEKYRNHAALFADMFFTRQIAPQIIAAPSLQAVVQLLQSFPLMGPFMSYQTAIDLNYSDLLTFSENDYTQAGPGALRGLAKCFTDLGGYTPAETILWMMERQDIEFARLSLPFNGLFGRKLQAIDCQGLFCETDKYCREAAPELASNRTRIKAKFAENPDKLPLFFPPKWNINDRIRV